MFVYCAANNRNSKVFVSSEWVVSFTISMFGTTLGQDTGSDQSSIPYVQTPYLNIDPHYLTGAEEYILPEDAGPVRSRVQTMFSIVGTATVTGAVIGGFESLRYSGLQWLKVWLQLLFFDFASFLFLWIAALYFHEEPYLLLKTFLAWWWNN